MRTLTVLCEHQIGYAAFIIDTPYGRSVTELVEWLGNVGDGDTVTLGDIELGYCNECITADTRGSW